MTDITSHLLGAPQQSGDIDPMIKSPKLLESDQAMRAAAIQFEAAFLTEMLKHSGLGQMPEAFNGGVGEEGFSSFLTQEYAKAIASTRSTGIADQIYQVLKERSQR